jgi:uncharacterized protein
LISRSALIDTNVVVSGLLTASAASPTARILDGMIAGRFRFLLSLDLISEYIEVPRRPKIRSRHGLSDEQIDSILRDVVANAVMVEVESETSVRKSSDHHLLRILAAVPDAFLVTGDDRLSASLPKGVRAIDPRQFAESSEL